MTTDLSLNHKCFGCGKQVEDFEPHIHVGLDEWSGKQGLETFGLDDLLTFPFCSECIEDSPDGWTAEQHEIPRAVRPSMAEMGRRLQEEGA